MYASHMTSVSLSVRSVALSSLSDLMMCTNGLPDILTGSWILILIRTPVMTRPLSDRILWHNVI